MANQSGGDTRTFGGLLREQREAAGFTQAQLAERSGLSVRSIRNLERGWVRRPHRDSIMLLATALGLSPVARAELARELPGWLARRKASEHGAPLTGAPCSLPDR